MSLSSIDKQNTVQQDGQKAEVKKISDEELNLTHIVDQDIETLVALRMRAERNVSHHQRIIERVTQNIGRPRFFYVIVLFVALWIIVNTFATQLGLPFHDTPPFYWLQGIISLGALLMSNVVLITQNRQNKLAEERRHLDLQVSLLVERKVSKVIDLLEELRRDAPTIENRHDPQAEAMKENVDPHAIITSFNQSLEEAAKEL
ncbi:MAG TPA: hypothetical protein DHW02_11255 [Ktedonobacter sp.]|nr:hypothetical protein [Ktedonobacter sp.]